MQNTGDIYLGRMAWRWEIKMTPTDDGCPVSFGRAVRALRSFLRVPDLYGRTSSISGAREAD
ncbi:Uncharacterised protein [Mycobacteroides abscessus subsp. bolletii]|nr:Uncharacterised protein [Mycobacteroides abscessus subsp. bolletii]SKQ27677.1 Uncharacterised protein [Mycobacteroides abscessus subsp. bolletii]